ncbi:MAG: hypothetical protein A2428_10350 [Bdellovibrionales bacterium RIFOXYC1_FULL_54_43]|nr:MAG: hypothetical protein A2428_10350 [Bdellovibrionales bacterium RIFOXYC1_FULL_54_43]
MTKRQFRRFRFSTIMFFLSVCVLTPSGGAWSATDAELEKTISEALSVRHPTEGADWWRSLGPNAPRVIIRMYEASDQIYQRLRLLEALAWFDDSTSVEFLKLQAERTADDVLRNAAIRSVGIARGANEEEFVSKFLKHPEPQTRLAAAETLKRMNDSRADKILEKYLNEEKTPWITARLKGEAVVQRRLKITSSSDDRLNPELTGTWAGFWVAPGAGSPGMESRPAVLRLKVSGATAIEGELNLKKGGKAAQPKAFVLAEVSGKSSRIAGVLVETPASDSAQTSAQRDMRKQPREIPFEAELVERAGLKLIEFRAPSIAAILVVRRTGTSQ